MFTFGSDPEATVLVSLTPLEAIRLMVILQEKLEEVGGVPYEIDVDEFLQVQDLALKVALAKTASHKQSA